MSIFAPNGNINNELNAPLNDDTLGVVGNIITYNPIFYDPQNPNWSDGLVAVNMDWQLVEDPFVVGTAYKGTPGGSAFIASFAEFKEFQKNHVSQLADTIPLSHIAATLNVPEIVLDKQIVEQKLRDLFAIPVFTPILPDTIPSVNIIKSTYCRYITPNLPDSGKFIDCGLAEDHEIRDMINKGSNKYSIKVWTPIPGLDQIDVPLCLNCFRWIVYCGLDSELRLEAFDPSLFDYDTETGTIFDKDTDNVVNGRLFYTLEEAKDFYNTEMNKPSKWIKIEVGPMGPPEDLVCEEISSFCADGLDPFSEDYDIVAGPFDTEDECNEYEPKVAVICGDFMGMGPSVNARAVVITPNSTVKIDPETNELVDSEGTPVYGEIFDTLEEANEFINNLENYKFFKFKDTELCEQVHRICFENPDDNRWDPNSEDSDVLTGPHDTIEECNASNPSPPPTTPP